MIHKKIISIIIFLLVITLYIFFISNKKITLQRSNQIKENLYKYKITNDYEKILNIKEEKNYIYVLSQKENQNNTEYKLIKYNLELSNIEKEVTFNTIKLENVKLIFENDLIKVISKNNINIHTFEKNLKSISKIVKNIKSYDVYGEYNNEILYTKDNKIYINDKLYDEVLKTCNKATDITYKDNSFIYFDNEELNIRCIYNINKRTTDYIDDYNVEIINDGYFLYNNDDILVKKDNEKKYFLDSKNELDNLKINNDGTKLLTFNKELKELKIYDLENNKILNKINLELNTKEYILLQILNDLAYIVVTDGTSYDLYVWDYNKNVINENMKERNISKIESYELVNKIKNSFNVNINIYDKGIRYFNDFYALPSNDIELTLDRLKETYEVLNYFNKDFFDKFNINDNLGIEIYLTGKVSPSNLETQISNPSAYSLVMNKTYIIALNINTKEYKKTLCHELMHTIENNMLYLYENKIIEKPFNKWNTLNPKNFDYNNSYTDETNEEYTISNNKDIYFIDSYSKTYPSEDRARIFEQLCNSKNVLNEYSNIKKKALYLKDEIIRVYPNIKDSNIFNKLYNMS